MKQSSRDFWFMFAGALLGLAIISALLVDRALRRTDRAVQQDLRVTRCAAHGGRLVRLDYEEHCVQASLFVPDWEKTQ